ncbi:MAG: exodeoxyribonuclease VII small subunit [Coriobacteriia bacterium]|nr:exodeoxyribonuclease VII small subunit [Coriobacteriia bacterium]
MDEVSRPDVTDLPFGAALAELEGIVAELESGELELEDSLERYERGVALLKALQTRLADAQQKVTMLIGEIEPDDASEARE